MGDLKEKASPTLINEKHNGQTEHVDLKSNINARIVNPLAGLTRQELVNDVENFVQNYGLSEHRETFVKGALLAQRPGDYLGMEELSTEEKDMITHERSHRWSHTFALYFTIAIASLGAAVQGWDQTGSNGANLSVWQAFGIPDTPGSPNAEYHSWLIGIVNAAPYIGSVGLGCWLSDPLNSIIGRRGVIFVTAIILIATPIGSAFTQTWQQLLAVRLVLGIGMGLKGSTVPVLCSENSPTAIRGALTMSWQFWTAFGIFLGFCANAIVADTGAIAWRLQLGSAFIPAVPLAIGIFFVPESPRWLMKKGRYPKAYRSLLRLRFTPLQAARDMYYIHKLLDVERAAIGHHTNYAQRIVQLFTVPRTRRATYASGMVMLAQQLCGINIIAFYSSTVFVNAGYNAKQALYASLGFGAINFLFALPAFWTIDTFGRRSLLLATFPNMAWTLLAAGLCNLIGDEKLRLAFVALFIYIFAMFYSVGEGPVPFAYSAEVFDLGHREVGMAWAVSVCLGFAAVLGITFPRMVLAMTTAGAFGFYAGLNVIGLVGIFFLCPETKQRSLEELDQVFSVPVPVFAHYQIKTWIPWFIQRWVFFRKETKLEPLYKIDGELAEEPSRAISARSISRSDKA